MLSEKETLSFPNEFSFGRLIVYVAGDPEPYAMLDAKGSVLVPKHAKLILDVSQRVCDYLEQLQVVPNKILANGVHISQKKLDHTDFRPLQNLANLTELAISLCGVIRVEQLCSIGRIDSLERLSLAGTEIDWPDFSWLLQFPNLNWLSLSGTAADEKNLQPLFDLPLLHHLDLGYAKLSDQTVRALWILPNLESLVLNKCDISDAALDGMGSCHHLHTLSLSHTSVSDVGVEKIVRQSNLNKLELKSLAFQSCSVSDKSLVHLSSLQSLRLLNVWGTDVSTEGIAYLKNSLSDCKVIAR